MGTPQCQALPFPGSLRFQVSLHPEPGNLEVPGRAKCFSKHVLHLHEGLLCGPQSSSTRVTLNSSEVQSLGLYPRTAESQSALSNAFPQVAVSGLLTCAYMRIYTDPCMCVQINWDHGQLLENVGSRLGYNMDFLAALVRWQCYKGIPETG